MIQNQAIVLQIQTKIEFKKSQDRANDLNQEIMDFKNNLILLFAQITLK